MRASTRQRPVAVCVALIAFFALGCGGGARNVAQSATAGDAVRVGSYDFAESRLLAHLYAQALKAAGVKTSLVLGVGSEEVLDPALMQHAVDVVPAYTGTSKVRFARAG